MKHALLALAFGGLLTGSGASHCADADRGRALYDARCDLCHRTSVHVREARRASSFDGLRQQVARWNAELRAGWTEEEIIDVTLYLNRRYYHFPCPENVCGSGRADAGRHVAHPLWISLPTCGILCASGTPAGNERSRSW